ncbi:hypothetical protein N9Y31_08140 [Alphaproteobacteria bacterium]|nr:hypothetical protein [Alphaproteobacteria bacterium]
MARKPNKDIVTSKMAATAASKAMRTPLLARFDELTQMPKSLTKSLERLNSAQEQYRKKLNSFSNRKLDVPKFDVPQTHNIKSNITATLDNHHQAIRDAQIRRENELKDRHNEIVTMQANIVDAINQTVNYQKNLSEGSNRVQLAILCLAIASLVVSSYGVWWA